MPDKLHIAIVGCGASGMAAALSLSDEHSVTVFDQFATPQAVGAGLLLQPTGLQCLAQLGLLDTMMAYGAPIKQLHGQLLSGKNVLDLHYSDLGSDVTGLGIHRGALFAVLYQALLKKGIACHSGKAVTRSDITGEKRAIYSFDDKLGEFDLVVDASGTRSLLHEEILVKRDREYAYGALWGVVNDPAQRIGQACLQQYYQGGHTMLGVMPIGHSPDNATPQCTFFWSLPLAQLSQWQAQPLTHWHDKVLAIWPEIAPLVTQFQQHEDLAVASYKDVVLKKPHAQRLVYIGDAAHSMSPQMGQGVNLGLMDALQLARSLQHGESLSAAFADYQEQRRRHWRFYQWASRFMTPLFQSDGRIGPWCRDLSFGYLCKAPFFRRQFILSLAGVKDGLFTHFLN